MPDILHIFIRYIFLDPIDVAIMIYKKRYFIWSFRKLNPSLRVIISNFIFKKGELALMDRYKAASHLISLI